jgi:hypothetical protein
MASSADAAMVAHSVVGWLQIFGLGALVGAFGQGARMIVGLKKLNDAASSANTSLSELIVVSRLIISLAIGAVAGSAAAIGTVDPDHAISLSVILGIAAAGYSGADFIEGFVSRSLGTPDAAAGQQAVGTGGNTSASSADDAEG